MRTLVIDTVDPAKPNTDYDGLLDAYKRVGEAISFHCRELARLHGRPEMNRRLCATALGFRPDIVHMDKSNTLRPETVRRIKAETGAYVVQVYGDFRERLPSHVYRVGRECDITYFAHGDEARFAEYRRNGLARVGHWPYGTDPRIFKPFAGPGHDAVFMLNWYTGLPGMNERRRSLIEAMADAGLSVHVYGQHLDRFGFGEKVARHGPVFLGDFAAACSKARIALALSIDIAHLYTSWPRLLNSMACERLTLTNYFPGLETVFGNKKHLVWYRSVEEAVDLAKFYLAHPAKRKRIAAAGREAVLAGHTWDHRVQAVLGDMK